MLNTIAINNFAGFETADITFAPGLNVVVGENGTGKSMLLKLAYALAKTSEDLGRQAPPPSKDDWQRAIAAKLLATCKPDSLGRLVTRRRGTERCEVAVDFVALPEAAFSFSFSSKGSKEVKLSRIPEASVSAGPIFIPTKEMLSSFPGFAAAVRKRELAFDDTYFDLALALEDQPLKPGARPKDVSELITLLEGVMGGRVHLDAGRFYLKTAGGNLEMPLVAEGVRKLATIAYLVLNGTLRQRGILIFDEPETNLNPKLIVTMAQALVRLAEGGVQVIISTHSLFLLRQLRIELAKVKTDARYLALSRTDTGIHVDSGDDVEDVEPLTVLEAELLQTDAYMALP
jgi:energy-coupling factor transporter ATP-binding protein EcfA2